MAGLPWIKVEVILPSHPKLQRLEKQLGLEDGLGVLTRLWCWTATYYPEGEFPASATDAMETSVTGSLTVTGSVTEALVMCGWLDELAHGERYRVHAWEEYQSAHADKAEREKSQIRERVRKYRNRKRTNALALPGTVTGNGYGNAPCNGVTGERERERETEREREKVIPCASQSEQKGLAVESNELLALKQQLTQALGLPETITTAPKREQAEVAAFFENQLKFVAPESIVADAKIFARKAGVTPTSLKWLKGWFERLPLPTPEATP
jgi:hypothetical protein